MATPSRVGLNDARHKAGFYAKQKEESKKREKEFKDKEKKVSPKEHEERVRKLKELGILK